MHLQELTRAGEALFKIRGKYLKWVIVASGIIAYLRFLRGDTGPFESASYNQAWFWAAFGVASAGALFRILTSGHAALGTSGVTKKEAIAAELNTTGPYSLVRNPLYVGRILNFTGIAMLSGSWEFGMFVMFASILVYERISTYEEAFLLKEFPEAHAKWAVDVPFLLPRLRGWKKPKYPFWIRRCIKREDKKVVSLFFAIVLCDFASRGFKIEEIPSFPIWYILWAVVLVLYVVSRSLRKFTTTFDGIT